MCCFSGPVESVSGTSIFARPGPDGSELLAYRMSFRADAELAMILPLPTPPGVSEDAVTFIDLSGYPKLFEDLAAAFVDPNPPVTRGAAPMAPPPTLRVHRVGDFEASFVPTQADFSRLDRRFRLDDAVWGKLPRYRDWGFAVFKLRPAEARPAGMLGQLFGRRETPSTSDPSTVHPMAFRFPRRDPSTLFFPTVHVHDGEVHDWARFDHALYCQPPPIVADTMSWPRGQPVSAHVAVGRTGGLVDAHAPVFRLTIGGDHPNEDVEVPTPPVTKDELQCVHERFALRVVLRHAYVTYASPRDRRWRETARTRARQLVEELGPALARVVDEHAAAWGVQPYDEALPECRVEGNAVVRNMLLPDRYGMLRSPEPETGPVRLLLHVSSDDIEPQDVWLCFAEAPDASRLAEIDQRLAGALEALSG